MTQRWHRVCCAGLDTHFDLQRCRWSRLRFACIPTPATLDGFDLDAASGIDRNLINELATCRYLESATNILLIGAARTDMMPGIASGPTAVAS